VVHTSGVIDVRIANTPQEREDAFAVRVAVFVDEQGIARADELDDFDASATHCVAYDEHGTPCGAGRLLLFDDYAKVGRMAVLASHRKTGAGAAVLRALETEAASRGITQIKLSAQLHARGFYERCGYTAHGDVYDDVGIPHVDMDKRLAG
jgi:predicted GNAT family N-acyltransferase